MRNIINSLAAIAILATAMSCSDQKPAERILDDLERQDEVLTAIANDSSLLTKLHQKMRDGNKMSMNGGSAIMRSCMAMMDEIRK
jgi:hypothetical protein